MLLRNSATHYGQVARLLHWTSVATIVTAVVFSTAIGQAGNDPERAGFVASHTAAGLALLGLMMLRFAWRLANPNPVLSYTIRPWQQRAAISVHWFLYAAVITECLVGVAQALSSDTGLRAFGVTVAGTAETSRFERLGDIHAAMANLIYIAVAVHITAALYHQVFGVRD